MDWAAELNLPTRRSGPTINAGHGKAFKIWFNSVIVSNHQFIQAPKHAYFGA
jgi:hypothetical protein